MKEKMDIGSVYAFNSIVCEQAFPSVIYDWRRRCNSEQTIGKLSILFLLFIRKNEHKSLSGELETST